MHRRRPLMSLATVVVVTIGLATALPSGAVVTRVARPAPAQSEVPSSVLEPTLGATRASDGARTGGGGAWRGSRRAQPASYRWLDDYTPDTDYELVVVRGLRPAQVRRTLGTVRRSLGRMAPGRAELWVYNHTDDQTYEAPPVAQIGRRGPAVVAYVPYWVLGERVIARLSRRGVAVHFTTTVELDTYITVARRGEVIRTFDAGFRPPRRGALREERGLDWGARHQNIWATAWAFSERVTRIHLSRTWFDRARPTHVFAGRAP